MNALRLKESLMLTRTVTSTALHTSLATILTSRLLALDPFPWTV